VPGQHTQVLNSKRGLEILCSGLGVVAYNAFKEAETMAQWAERLSLGI
jgi:hypothetical protein